MITFRRHGEDRLYERTSTETGYVVDLIEKGFALPLGYERRTTKNHYLFYSVDDRDNFVAVVDDANKEVVTVLPINWHNAWRISPEAEMMAQDLALNREGSRYLSSSGKMTNSEGKALVSCLITKQNGDPKGPIRLGKFQIEHLQDHQHQVWEALKKKIDGHLKKGEALASIFWDVGQKRVEIDPATLATAE